jgi:sulfate adenylyltransferase subunit 1 (EFTu-like GTPase family)
MYVLNFIKWIEMLYDRVQNRNVIIAVVKLKLNSFAKNVMNFIVKSVHQLLINLHKLTTIVVKVARMQKTNINCKKFNY